MHDDMIATVLLGNDEDSTQFELKTGVKQGYLIALTLLHFYCNCSAYRALKNTEEHDRNRLSL
jgi:hypothetical protein